MGIEFGTGGWRAIIGDGLSKSECSASDGGSGTEDEG